MVREVEEWSAIHIRDEITTNVGHSALPTDRPTHDIKFTEIGCNLAVGQTDTQTNSIKKHNLPNYIGRGNKHEQAELKSLSLSQS